MTLVPGYFIRCFYEKFFFHQTILNALEIYRNLIRLYHVNACFLGIPAILSCIIYQAFNSH